MANFHGIHLRLLRRVSTDDRITETENHSLLSDDTCNASFLVEYYHSDRLERVLLLVENYVTTYSG